MSAGDRIRRRSGILRQWNQRRGQRRRLYAEHDERAEIRGRPVPADEPELPCCDGVRGSHDLLAQRHLGSDVQVRASEPVRNHCVAVHPGSRSGADLCQHEHGHRHGQLRSYDLQVELLDVPRCWRRERHRRVTRFTSIVNRRPRRIAARPSSFRRPFARDLLRASVPAKAGGGAPRRSE